MSDYRRLASAACGVLAFLALLPLANAATPTIALSGERRRSFNDDWRFYRGEAAGAEKPEFDDSAWRPVRLPHDWSIEGPFDPKLNPQTGALPISGTGWYRKSFALPADASGKYFSIEFDGAMSNSKVWLNGHDLGGRPYGYIGFSLDLTPYLNFGGTNVIAVRLTPEDHASRWYPGAGVYRNVWLDVTGHRVCRSLGHLCHHTQSERGAGHRVGRRPRCATAPAMRSKAEVQNSVLDAAGVMVSRNHRAGDDSGRRPAAGAYGGAYPLFVNHPKRWDIDHPNLYTLVTEVIENNLAVDRYTTPFGIRTIAFDKEKGFSPERPPSEAARRMRPPRSGRARRGRQSPRHRTPVADPQGRGRQCAAHQSQSAGAGDSRILRPARPAGDG
jgi:beta-galactosidase